VEVAPEQRQLSVFLFLFPARFNVLFHLALEETHTSAMSPKKKKEEQCSN